MKKNKTLNSSTKGTVRTLESLFEVLILSVLYYWIWRWGYRDGDFPAYLGTGKYVLTGIYALLSFLFIKSSDGFEFGNLRRLDLGIAQWIAVFIVNLITYFQLCLIANRMVTPVPMLVLMAVDVIACAAFVCLYCWMYPRLYATYNMVMIYGSESAVGMKLKMDKRRDKYRVDRLIHVNRGLDYICQQIVHYDAVIINDVTAELRNDILKFCYKNALQAYVVPKITDLIMRGADTVSVFDTPVVVVRGMGLTIGQRIVKRAMDIALSLVALIVASPIMAAVAIAIKLEDGGPVFYKQKRATLNGKEFDILKFRSMIVDAEKAGISIPATGQDPRITKVGRIIRACRVDELPQILNILKGDMSIVGPRPERLEHMQQYGEMISEFDYRLKVKGGLTGYAQIYGKYNTNAYDKLRLDLIYIENYSLLLDIKLILMTVRILFSKESTEGFDEKEKNEQRLQELLNDMQEEALTGAEK